MPIESGTTLVVNPVLSGAINGSIYLLGKPHYNAATGMFDVLATSTVRSMSGAS